MMVVKKRPKLDEIYCPCLCISTEIDRPYAHFLIDAPLIYSTSCSLQASSKDIVINQVHFCLNASFLTYDSSLIKLTIHFQKIGTTDDVVSQCALLMMDLEILEKEKVLRKEENIIKKIQEPNVNWHVGDIPTTGFKSFREIRVKLHFKFVHLYDMFSIFYFSLHPPSIAPYFHLLNDKEVSNSYFPLKFKNQQIFTIKKILSHECEFFEKMFQKEWLKSNSTLEAIQINGWSDKSIIAVVLHLYTGWVPETKICEKIFHTLELPSSELQFHVDDWADLCEIAQMLNLNVLGTFSALQAKQCYTHQFEAFIQKLSQKK